MPTDTKTGLIGDSVRQGQAVMFLAWRRIPGVLILTALAMLCVNLADRIMPGNPLGWSWLMLAYLITSLAAYGAVFRLAAPLAAQTDQGNGPQGLQLRAMEMRLLWAFLLQAALFVFAIVLLVFLLLALAAVIAYGHGHELTLNGQAAISAELGPVGVGIMQAAILLAVAVLFTLGLRLSLCLPASAYSPKTQVLSSLVLTRGRVLTVLAIVFIIGFPGIIIGVGGALAISAASRSGHDPLPIIVSLSVLNAALATAVQMPWTMGALASLYAKIKAGHKQ